jgi:hypothetical protein
MLRRVALVRTEAAEELSASITSNPRHAAKKSRLRSLLTDSCHPDDRGAKFIRNVGSYKSHTA